VLLSPELSGLTAAHCARVRASGVRLVGLALDEHEREALAALSVDEMIDSTVSQDALLTAIRGTVREARPAAVTPAPVGPERRDDAGSILAVVGAKGAPGASECAASLAALAARSWPTVLVEIDALGGGLDVRLGADANEGSILGLVRAANGGGVQAELVERWLTERAGWPAVLLGAPEPQSLIELAQPGAITRALTSLAPLYPLTVCDVGAFLADGHAAAALHREALIAADAVLLVLGARDTQLRHGLRQLDLLLGTLGIPPERLRVIANGIGAPGTASRSAITQTITAHLAERGVTVDAWVPWDTRGLTRAQRRGMPLATARQRSRYSSAISRLLEELFLPTVTPTAKGRKRRLSSPGQATEEQVVWQR
jgi:Flp pilus assembly CpaE family ATPase